MGRGFKTSGDYEERMNAFEMAILDKLAKKRGINLRKELEKERLFQRHHSFKRGIRQEMYEEMFGKGKEDK